MQIAASLDEVFYLPGGIARNMLAEMESAQALRWNTLGKFYSESGLPTVHSDIATVVRWNAMAEFYARNGLLTVNDAVAAQPIANR